MVAVSLEEYYNIITNTQYYNYISPIPFPVSLNLFDEGKQIGINSSALKVFFCRSLAPKQY